MMHMMVLLQAYQADLLGDLHDGEEDLSLDVNGSSGDHGETAVV